MTRLVDRLEREGLLERDHCTDDGRGCFAVLTDKGARAARDRAPDAPRRRPRALPAHFSPDELRMLPACWERVLPGAAARQISAARTRRTRAARRPRRSRSARRDPGRAPAPARCSSPTARSRTPAFVPLATKAVVKTLEVARGRRRSASTWCWATRSTCSSTPGHELIARARRPAPLHALGPAGDHRLGRLPGVLDGPRDGRRRDQGPRARSSPATAPARSSSIEEEGVRFRSYLDGSTKFMGPETSMEVQAALGSDIALVFDECTPFHVGRDYTARSTERTHRWLDRCLAWHAEHGPAGQVVYGIVQGGVEEDLRRGSAQEVAARAARRDRDRRLAGRGQGADVRGRRAGRSRSCRTSAPRHLLGHRRDRRSRPRRRARHRHVRLRDADADRPPRDGARPRPGAPLARRPGEGALARGRRAAARRLPVPGLRRRLQPRLPPLPAARRASRRRCGCSRCTTSPSSSG